MVPTYRERTRTTHPPLIIVSLNLREKMFWKES